MLPPFNINQVGIGDTNVVLLKQPLQSFKAGVSRRELLSGVYLCGLQGQSLLLVTLQ